MEEESRRMNPKIRYEKYFVKERGVNVRVIQDGDLVGGTKQRALLPVLLEKVKQGFTEFVYAGPATGYAHVALSYACFITKCKATAFLQGTDREKNSSAFLMSKELGGDIRLFGATLKDIEAMALEYVSNENAKHGVPRVFLFPFGMDWPEFCATLKQQITEALPQGLIARPPKRVWLTVGSGTLLRVLGDIWRTTIFMPVQVGRGIWEDQYQEHNLWGRMGDGLSIADLKAPQKYFEAVHDHLLPPYQSLPTYDAKVWQHVLRHAKTGDFIWNVATGHSPENRPKALDFLRSTLFPSPLSPLKRLRIESSNFDQDQPPRKRQGQFQTLFFSS